ncbi:hypothetical protein CEXT_474142 [Caerostris extrusa]|uniref:Tudor domain-containing protein n=1 Tax=Caerostris extrusa TaxID=172846 RepID=A0AAV4XEN5_CAEEX|nr:hypothetical protein CEXT_474142 [Caerostris extrusa]
MYICWKRSWPEIYFNNSHNAMVGRNVSRGSFVHHTVMGRGRNQPVVSDHFPTPLKSKSIIQQSVESNFTLPANKGLEHSDGVHALKVVLEGNRRTAYQKSTTKGELSCKRCHQPYCTVKCQHSDWPKHKLICQSFPPAASVSRQLPNDSSYMSGGNSCSDNEKKFETASKEMTNVNENQKKYIKINEIQKTLLSLNNEYEIIVSNRCHPSNFWIQLNESKKILSQMEKEMATMELQTVVTCTVDDSKSSSSIVQFIDYGEISTVQNDQLYYLPQLFKKVPCTGCMLQFSRNDSGANIAWTDHDISSFQALTSNKNFTARVVCSSKSQYDVQLWCKDNGSCLFSLLTLPNYIEKKEDSESKDSEMKIPSVWNDLKEGAEVTVMAVEFKENKFWGLLDNGSNCALAIGELENLLQTVETEDISLIAEEGDVAVDFHQISINLLPEKFAIAKLCTCVALHKIENKQLTPSLVEKLVQETWSMEVKDALNLLLERTTDVRICYADIEKLYVHQLKDAENFLDLQKQIEKMEKIALTESPEINMVYCCLSSDGCYYRVYCIPVIVKGLNVLELKPQDSYKLEVIGLKLNVQLVRILNLPDINIVKYPSASSLKKLSLEKGDLVCARSSDKCWCRASISSVSTSSYKVLFIDFGNFEDVISEDVKCLPNDLLQFPVFCVPVKVTNLEKAKNVIDLSSMITVKTIDGTSSNMQFVEVVLPKGPNLPKIDSLQKQLMPLDKVDRISICYMQDDIFYIHLLSSKDFITMLESELSKGETFDSLINMPEIGDLVCAKFTDGIWYRGTVETVHRNNSCEICFIDYGNNEIITLDNMKILPDSLCSYPVFSIPIKFNNIEKLQSHIESGMSIFSVRVIALSPEQIPVIDVVEPEDNKKLSCIESQALPGSPIEAGVCYVEEDVFYLQKASDAEKLEELAIELQNPISLKSLSHTPTIGELLNIKYQDGQFYRGLVKEKCDNKYKIYFVDYGNTDVVDVTNMYCLPSKYSSWPMLCVAVKFDKSENIESLNVNSLCTVKYTGELINNVQVVRLYNEVTPILFSSLKSSPLEEGVHDVIFTSFDKYFHYIIKASDFTTMNEINSLLKEFKGEVIRHTPIVNEVLVVKCQNTQWCRGCLKEVNEISKTCNVYLIDFGTTETISFSDILYISDEISAFPVFCTKVSVDFSKSSIDSVSFGDSYSVTVFDLLPENIPVVKIFKPFMLTSLKQQVLPINELRDVMFFHQEDNRFFLQNVYDSSLIRETQAEVKGCSSSEVITHNPIIGELLCAQSKKNGIWYRCCVEDIVSLDKWRIRFVDYGNDEVVSRECLRPFTEELTVYPIFAIPVRIIENKCENPKIQFEQLYSVMAESLLEDNVQLKKSCSLAVTSSSSNIVNDKAKESITKYFYSNAEYVSFPIGEHDIIIYHVSDECSLFCAPYSMDGISTNLGLCSDITEYCENIKCSSYNSENLPDLDELVLAKYDDEKWYRAVIILCEKMEKKFMSAEIQSHICALTGFEMDDEKMPSIVQELKNFAVFRNSAPLKAFVSIEGEELLVNIPEITKHLIEKNLVVSSSQ